MRARRREPALSTDELRLWRGVIRDARPLRPDDLPAEPAEADPPPAPEAAPPTTPGPPSRDRFVTRSAPAQRGPALDPERPSGLDRRNWQRLKRGQLPIDARLDLHGATQAAAHDLLTGFLGEAQRRRQRCVLVVTGKGRTEGGILRHMVPRWLAEPGNRERIIAYCPAQLRHGGTGALYVLVRRARAGA